MEGDVELSVVIPSFNEEVRLPARIQEIRTYLNHRGISHELLLADDGSRDGTLAVMQAAAREDPAVKVVALPRNRGKGRASAEGVAASRGRLVLVSDADHSTPIAEVEKLEAALANGAEVAIASRAKRGARVEVSQPPHRVLMGKTFNLIVQALLLPGLWDTQCGFKLFQGDVARAVFADLETDRFAFDVEVLFRARRRGYRIAEVPVRWLHSAPTRVAAISASADMLKDVLRIRLRNPR
ncbi:MAG TPA: dolichyl-phosphate beta-glucosyltransferase [Candidatus Acidoferrales bacterium]|nr:dolichyl-phosphate beta-glucosyltransferase [Candidatus Acidoferrales bacterium]